MQPSRSLTLPALALAAAGCLPPDFERAESGAPVIGRLQFQDRLVNLTVESFADGPTAVPREAQATIMADVELEQTDRGRAGSEDSRSR
jgi:hypothetical protein